ncbi:hypothetical protein E2320_011148 [Naja naja]|nr:hypothetical protein E2320_011148 [Naja naja]
MEARSGGAEAGEPREAAVMAAAAFSDGEESDEAPEEVTFERAREAAAEERRLTGERARREKAILKEKRRHREELFKEQKHVEINEQGFVLMKSYQNIAIVPLSVPDTILKCPSSELDLIEDDKRKLLPENVLEELASTQTSINSTTDEQDQNVEDEVENQDDSEKDSEEEILATRCPPNYMAVRLKDQELSSQQQQEAKDFIQKHLYGASCNRTTGKGVLHNELRKYIDCVTIVIQLNPLVIPANQYFSVENKKNAVKKAAIQFVNRSWGKVKKEKATRFTKHWVSSKIIP